MGVSGNSGDRLRETLAEHEELHESANRLREGASSEGGAASAALLQNLRSFAARLYAHFRGEEVGSYLGIESRPEMASRLGHLRAEHAELRRTLDALLEEAAAADDPQVLGPRVVGFLEELVRHELAENAILQECVPRDTGAGG